MRWDENLKKCRDSVSGSRAVVLLAAAGLFALFGWQPGRGLLLGLVLLGIWLTVRHLEQQIVLARQAADVNLQLTLKAIPDLMFELDETGRFVNVFSNNDDLLFAPRAQLLQRLVSEVLPAEAAAVVKAALQDTAAQGYSSGQVLRLDLPSGPRWFELSSTIKHLPSGERHFVTLSRDMTARKHAEDALAKSQQRLSLALAAAHMGVWEFDFQSGTLFWSAEILHYFGLPEEVTPSRAYVLSMTHPEDAALSDLAMTRALQERCPYRCEYRVLINGKTIWVEDRGEIQYAADGQPWRAVGTAQDITERKQAALALQQESEKNLALLRNASDGIHILNQDAVIIEASDSFCAMLGYTRQEIIGMQVSDWDVNFSREEAKAVVAAQFVSPVRQQFETRHRRKDGSIIDVEVSGFPLELAGQRVLFNSSRDITARKQAEQALQSSEQRARDLSNLLRLVSDNVPDMIWAKDLHKRFLFTNKAMCEQLLHAADTDEPLGKDDLFFATRERAMQPENREWHTFGELCQDSDTLTLQAGGPAQFDEFGNVRGKFLFLDVHKAPLVNSQGEVIGVVGSARDVTLQKAAEEKLRLAALVLENSSEAMLVTDADNRIQEINPAFTKLTGYTLEEVRGKNPSVLNSGHHPAAFYQTMWQELQSSGHWQGEIRNRRKDGEIYIEWLTINTIRDEHGAVQRYVALFSDITSRKKSEEQIWRHANFDPLTQLPNRRMFYERLGHDLKKALRSGERLALLFLDLDRFKEINDTLGHDTGDALLVAAARRLSNCVRDSDTVARLGGDEFILILNDLGTPNSVERVADNILTSLSQPFVLGNEVAYVSASIGITFYPDDASTVEGLLKNADQAMYVAKNAGRNRYAYFTNTMQQLALHRLQLLKDLRQAVLAQQFVLEYQPIVDLLTGRVGKAEVLLRWQHPQRGRIPPAEFVPLAEESGLIHGIGEWLFAESVQCLRQLTAQFDPDFQLSINQSPLQIQAGGGQRAWGGLLQAAGLSGHNLVFEITEGLLLDTSPPVVAELMAYRDAGIQVAIDDFGTGYSSLAYLKKMHIDYVKIDQSFVRNLVEDASNQALTEAIIVMAHKLELKVIAEGVETAEQAALLRQLGCDYAQGYWYAKPLPRLDFEAFLHRALH